MQCHYGVLIFLEDKATRHAVYNAGIGDKKIAPAFECYNLISNCVFRLCFNIEFKGCFQRKTILSAPVWILRADSIIYQF